jgi:hypothetical protein
MGVRVGSTCVPAAAVKVGSTADGVGDWVQAAANNNTTTIARQIKLNAFIPLSLVYS